jgi:uncharacterized protein
MRVLISGASGMIGGALSARLRADGHFVVALSRRPGPGDIGWNPAAGEGPHLASSSAVGEECFDAVVHLAGESIASGRWTAAKKARILDSRVRGTRLLTEALASSRQPPRTLLAASAIGFYGDRPGETLDESSASGGGFLAEVCRQWEAAAEPARAAGVRVVHTRFGMVLSADGGALKPLLTVFRLGLGGPIGSGRQTWSWIALDDVAAALAHLLTAEDVAGPVNVAAPNPLPQRDFAACLGRQLGRPAFLPLPAFGARLALGQMAGELLLPDQRVRPARLLDSGFTFAHPDLPEALRSLLGAR